MTGLTIRCYRDILKPDEEEEEEAFEDENDNDQYYVRTAHKKRRPGYGITLYFVDAGLSEPQRELTDLIFQYFPAIFDAVKSLGRLLIGKNPRDTARLEKAIPKYIATNNPIVQFMRNCIDGGTAQEKCITLSKQAGISISRQSSQVLYKYLKLEKEITREPVTMPAMQEAPPPSRFDMYARVQDFFEDELAQDDYFGTFEYIRNDLSECSEHDITTSGQILDGDFLFEMGELETGTIKYFGQYTKGKLTSRIYPEFNKKELIKVLKSRS